MKITFKRHPTLKRLGDKWRKPRGDQNKSKRRLKGKPLMPSIGYGTAAERRGFHPSGMREVIVRNIGELSSVKDAVARIASSVGKKKRLEMAKIAQEKKITLLNGGIKK